MMNMCAVAGLASSGTRFASASIFRNASASAYGLPVIWARAGVGREFARPRDRHLNQHRGNRREDHHRKERNRIGPRLALVAAAAAEHAGIHRHARQHHDRRGNGRRDGADQDVAVLDVGKLVRNDAFELVRAERLQDAFGRGDRCMLRDSGRSRTRSETGPG